MSWSFSDYCFWRLPIVKELDEKSTVDVSRLNYLVRSSNRRFYTMYTCSGSVSANPWKFFVALFFPNYSINLAKEMIDSIAEALLLMSSLLICFFSSADSASM